MQAIILAGGLGKRLQGHKHGMPKPMVDISGRPFLSLLLDQLHSACCKHVCLAVGHKYSAITQYFGDKYRDINISYSVEKHLLGTGGAVKQALESLNPEENVVVINGDSFTDVDFTKLINFHKMKNADITLTCSQMSDYSRYGTVLLDNDNKVIQFVEKKEMTKGLINAGIYVIKNTVFDKYKLPSVFSFETDFMIKYIDHLNQYGFRTKGYFIDIGIPEDLARARKELAQKFS